MVARVERVSGKASTYAAPFWIDIPAFTVFADEVREAIQFGELTFTARKRLLRRADHHHIRRFDANLIMAMVQNRTAETTLVDQRRSRASWVFPVAIAATVQAIIVLAVMILFRG